MNRIWTIEEANEVLPELRQILAVLVEQKSQAELAQKALAELERLAQGNGHGLEPELEHRHRRLHDILAQLRQGIAQINQLGCELKDLDIGLVDFPSTKDGEEILLCWQMSEPSVLFWHDRESGYSGRQPL